MGLEVGKGDAIVDSSADTSTADIYDARCTYRLTTYPHRAYEDS